MSNPQTLLDGVLARKLERLTLVSRKRLVGQGQGDRRSLRKGSSLEFADYRHYVEGDDPARVDWNIYSRTDSRPGNPMVLRELVTGAFGLLPRVVYLASVQRP